MKRGKLITIEGTEGAGKSTALQFIEEYFATRQIPCVFTREPGGTALAEEIRCLLLHHQHAEKMCAETELLLMFAARAQHIHQCILPALNAGNWVVSDRYIDASFAYQGGGRGLNVDQINLLDQMVVREYYPDLTLLLDIPAEIGIERAEKRDCQKDRIEQEAIDFFERVRHVYLERATKDAKRIKIVDASLDLATVQLQIRQILDDFMKSVT